MQNDLDLATPVAATRGRPPGAWADFSGLLAPRALALRNRYRRLTRGGRLSIMLLTLLALGLGAAIFGLSYRGLVVLRAAEELGAVVTYKLLSMSFVAFFFLLFYSNMVSALSIFYLSDELDRLVAAPIAWRRFFYARFTEMAVDSSWMLLLFSIPAFLAYGVAHGAGTSFYLAALVTLPAFVVIPAALGVMLTSILVTVFPARRTMEILALLAAVALVLLILTFRMLRPERLLDPDSFADFQLYLGAMRTPESAFLPFTWATEILHRTIEPESGGSLFYLLLLLSTAAVAAMAAEVLVGTLYLPTWSKAQEGRRARLTQTPLWESALGLLTAVFPPQMRLLMAKEMKTFFRDTGQWSQLVLLAALVILHVYNFSVLPSAWKTLLASSRFGTWFLTVLFLLNIAVSGFIVTSIAVRFVYPSFSLEGRAFWVVKTAPLTLRRVWWTKFWVNAIPLIALGEILVFATDFYVHVNPFTTWLSAATLFAVVIAIVALGLAVGATWPKFDADNAAKIAASVGGLVYMVLSLLFILTVVTLEAWPVYISVINRPGPTPLPPSVVACMGAVLALSAAVFLGATLYGIRRLESIEQA